jgi:hypothetical protein
VLECDRGTWTFVFVERGSVHKDDLSISVAPRDAADKRCARLESVSNGDDVASDKSVDELLPCFSPIKPEVIRNSTYKAFSYSCRSEHSKQMQGVRTYRIHESKVRT